MGGPIGRLLLPPLSRTTEEIYPRKLASTHAVSVAVALTNCRLATGHYPATLDELVPKYLSAVPSDPFDGKPMRYVLSDGSATIYSVGPDRVDDGGDVELPAEGSRPVRDVGLVLKKPVTPANPS